MTINDLIIRNVHGDIKNTNGVVFLSYSSLSNPFRWSELYVGGYRSRNCWDSGLNWANRSNLYSSLVNVLIMNECKW